MYLTMNKLERISSFNDGYTDDCCFLNYTDSPGFRKKPPSILEDNSGSFPAIDCLYPLAQDAFGSGSTPNTSNTLLLFFKVTTPHIPDTIIFKYNHQSLTLEKARDGILSSTITNTKNKIEDLRWILGLNISEIANILKVKRPTVYEWLDEKTRRPRKQERLEIIYDLCKTWEKFEIGRIGSFLYKKLDKNSLFDLLNEETLNKALIEKHFNKIKEDVVRQRDEKKQRENKLKKTSHPSATMDKREVKKWIDRTMRTIG